MALHIYGEPKSIITSDRSINLFSYYKQTAFSSHIDGQYARWSKPNKQVVIFQQHLLIGRGDAISCVASDIFWGSRDYSPLLVSGILEDIRHEMGWVEVEEG